MKAIVYDRYGSADVLRLKDIEKPIPRDHEVLIRVKATTVTSADCRIRSLSVPLGFGLMSRLVFGISRPRRAVLGVECAGVIEATGHRVSRFKPGDEVFALDGFGMGCYAQYKALREDRAIAIKPTGVSWTQAAAMSFGGTTALSFLRRGKLQAGQRVLINGASGSVGTAAVQLARHLGAEVTAVCSEVNAQLVRSLGAAHVIDYTREDFTRNGQSYDIILDTVGTAPYARSHRSLTRSGRLLLVLATVPNMLPMAWLWMSGGRRLIAGPAAERAVDLAFLADLAQAGAFKPVLESSYALDDIVQAHRHVDSGRKKGNVAILVD